MNSAQSVSRDVGIYLGEWNHDLISFSQIFLYNKGQQKQ